MKNNILKVEALNELKALLGPENIKENEVMAAHLTMEVGGEANYFLTPATAESLKGAMVILKREAIPCYILGKGSNVIVRDEGFDGAMVHIGDNMSDIIIEGNVCRAQAGALLKDVSEKIADASLTGFEFACGIPGSVGGAITMNAGAYDSDMSHIVKEVTLLRDDGEIITVKGSDMGFGYRQSIISTGRYIVLEAVFELEKGDKAAIDEKIAELTFKRESSQPLELPSCGSTFKRPEGYFTGKLVMDAGLRGARVGGASVSEKHCGFVVNDKQGTASDVLGVIDLVKKTVLEKYGVELQCEVKII